MTGANGGLLKRITLGKAAGKAAARGFLYQRLL